MYTMQAVLGDITKMNVDAIVNAANRSLLGGGGVDGAIHRAAGPRLLKECRRLRGCNTGDAKTTKGYDLPAKYVIHTVGPIWQGGSANEEVLLKQCYLSCVAQAVEKDVRSIAFPAISCGVYRFPVEIAVRIAVSTVEAFMRRNDELIALKEVYFVCFDEGMYQKYSERLNNE